MRLNNYTFVLLGIIQFLISLFCFHSENKNVLLLNLFIYWGFSLLYALKRKQNTIIYFFFLVTFFVFLMGQDVILNIFNYITDVKVGPDFSNRVMSHVYFSLHTSLFFVSLGVIYRLPKINRVSINMTEEKRLMLKLTLLKTFKFTIPFKYLKLSIEVFNTIVFGYAVVSDDSLNVPYLLIKAAQIADISFLAFLLLAPQKDELKKPLILFIGASILSLLAGERGYLMYELMLIFSYLLFRDYVSKRNNDRSNIIISKKLMLLILISSPFFLIFLGMYASIRSNANIQSLGFMGDFLGFFIQQGGSYSLIGYAEELKNELPMTNISYTFGPLLERIEPFRTNYLQPDKLTYDAYYGNNLGATITCLVNPNYYYGGGGLGTQYIAEIYADFGYFGIALFSFILGRLISKAVFFNSKNWIVSVLFASTLTHIFAMPRSFYLTFLSAFLSIWNIAFLLIVNHYVKIKLRKLSPH